MDGINIVLRLLWECNDTPELDQPWGLEAKAALKNWAEKRRGEVRIVDTDRYGRPVATLWIDGESDRSSGLPKI